MESLIFVYGPPGAGKSTVGRLLAEALGRPFWDADAEIEAEAGQSIPEIFAGEGEAGFRARERAVVEWLLSQPEGVIALGGGALLDEAVRAPAAAAGPVLCLRAPLEILRERLAAAEGERPLLSGGEDKLATLLAARHSHYDSFPLQLDATGSPEEIMAAAQIRLGCFHVRGMGAGYDVWVRSGGLRGLGRLLRGRELGGPVALVSDENVAPLYAGTVMQALERAGYAVHLVTMPAGEEHKTMATVHDFWAAFLEAGLERGSTAVALGGGVVTDLAGFAAATYLRGMVWVAAPTSLLGMVDASLGGKTGADLPQGKNLVGAFHAPRLVLADPEVLVTLPPAELRSGLAEVVKHGVIADPALFAQCAAGEEAVAADWDRLVRRAMAVKVRIIQADPYEGGRRAALNLGHTVGHGVELASDFRVRHGEAVAIGMVAETRLAVQMGLAKAETPARIAAALEGLGLPTEIPGDLEATAVIEAMRLDKKRQRGTVRFALPRVIGEVEVGVSVPDWPARITQMMEA